MHQEQDSVEKREKQIFNIDWLLIIQYLALVSIGIISIYSTGYDDNIDMTRLTLFHSKQIIWFAIAVTTCFVILLIDSRFFSYYANTVYVAICFILLMLVIFGKEINGAKSWISIGGQLVQPSEFAKICTSLMLSFYLAKYRVKDILKDYNYIRIFAIIAIPMMLIIAQNDFGSSFVFLAFVLVLYKYGFSYFLLLFGLLAGILFILTILIGPLITTFLAFIGCIIVYQFNRKQFHEPIILLIACFIGCIIVQAIADLLAYQLGLYQLFVIIVILVSLFSLIWGIWSNIRITIVMSIICIIMATIPLAVNHLYNVILKPYQQNRIEVFLGLTDDPSSINYNVIQSKIAIGSGGILGKGYLKGTQTHLNFVPEQETDFIFCAIGEEWGFIGSSLFILLYISFLVRIIMIAERQRERMSMFYGYCVFSIFLFHFSINIAMTIGLFPVIGIPLPFISYGGSSLLAFSCLLFIFLNFDSNRKKFLQNT